MLLFCPICSNTLTIVCDPALADGDKPGGLNCLECRTCTYQYAIPPSEPLWEPKYMRAKEVDDVIGGKEAWDKAEQADAQCPSDDCDGGRAYFFQKQIRSADEPMTTFYRCTTCAHQWREN